MKKYRKIKKPVSLGNLVQKKNCLKNKKLQEVLKKIENSGEKALNDILMSQDLNENLSNMKEIFKKCSDAVFRGFDTGAEPVKCFIVFLDGMVNKDHINDNLLRSLMTDVRLTDTEKTFSSQTIVNILKDNMVSITEITEVNLIKDAVEKVLKGHCVLFIDQCSFSVSFSVKGWESRKAGETSVESVIRGPQEAFVEDLKVNISQIRRRLKTPDLKMEKFTLGRLSKTDVVIAYIKGIADKKVVEELIKRINRIDTDIVIESGYIEPFIEDNPMSPFPQMDVTERPDEGVAALAEGRILVIIDGTPFILVLPMTFVNFLSEIEDKYVRVYFAVFVRFLRYTAFGISLLAPSFYIAITTLHQEMIPRSLLITLQSYRAEVPFPAVIEAILMEFTFEIVREAVLRLPKIIAPALSIVGALVIGQTAVQAGIASPVLIVVVALTGLCSFTIPAYNFGRTVRVIKYPIMILAASLGIFGIIMGVLFLLIHLASLRSLGVPYLSPLTPLDFEDWKNTVLRFPLWDLRKRPQYIQKKNIVRTKSGLKPGPEKNSSGRKGG